MPIRPKRPSSTGTSGLSSTSAAFPQRVRYDNLKPAVARVLMGRSRTESERFVALRSHYLFDVLLLSSRQGRGPREGWRRGRGRPLPSSSHGAHAQVSSLAELNELVAEGDRLDDVRHIDVPADQRGRTLRPRVSRTCGRCPGEPFEVAQLLRPRVDAKSRVCVRQCFYSVPVRYAGTRITVRLGAESVEVLDGAAVVARMPGPSARGSRPSTSTITSRRSPYKPGALAGATALHQARASGRFSAAHDRFFDAARRRLGDKEGTKALIGVLLAHRVLPYDAVVAGIEGALARRLGRSRRGGRRSPSGHANAR